MDTALPRSMRVKEIWRYPVKSLQGEKLSEARLDVSGVGGDRCWGIRDEITGKILTGRREPRLLLATAFFADDGEPDIVLPSGELCRGSGPKTDTALSDWLQRSVTLVVRTALRVARPSILLMPRTTRVKPSGGRCPLVGSWMPCRCCC